MLVVPQLVESEDVLESGEDVLESGEDVLENGEDVLENEEDPPSHPPWWSSQFVEGAQG